MVLIDGSADILAEDTLVLIDASGGTPSLRLYSSARTVNRGCRQIIRIISGAGAVLTVREGQTINGKGELALDTLWQSAEVMSDGQGHFFATRSSPWPNTTTVIANNGTTTAGLNITISQYASVALLPTIAGYTNRDGVVLASAAGHLRAGHDANHPSRFYGVAGEDIAPSSSGLIVQSGPASVSKSGAETWSAGDNIYLSLTPGKATNVAPMSVASWVTFLGVATEQSTTTIGKIDIQRGAKVQNC